ncbi:MAG: Rrf2 family transcriptional regulator [Campylobacterales bacterium]
MLLTKASEYAVLSLIAISKEDAPQDVESLSKKLEISKSFLAKILQSLAKEGILNSYKGAKGGFALQKKPEDISLFEIIEASEGRYPKVFMCSTEDGDCPKGKEASYICKLQPILNSLQGKIDGFLHHIKLSDMVD